MDANVSHLHDLVDDTSDQYNGTQDPNMEVEFENKRNEKKQNSKSVNLYSWLGCIFVFLFMYPFCIVTVFLSYRTTWCCLFAWYF